MVLVSRVGNSSNVASRPVAPARERRLVAVATGPYSSASASAAVRCCRSSWWRSSAPLQFLALARRVRARTGNVPALLAIGLPIAWVAAIPLATVGGGVFAGAYQLAVAALLIGGAPEQLMGTALAQPVPRVASEAQKTVRRPSPTRRGPSRCPPVRLTFGVPAPNRLCCSDLLP